MLCEEFAANYEVCRPGEIPTLGLPVVTFGTKERLAPAPRVEVAVTPQDPSQRWLGQFFGRQDGTDLLAHTPSASHLMVVAGGIAYWVPVLAPESFRVIAFQPVLSVHCAARVDLMILAGYARLVAIDGAGEIVWESVRLVSDGFAEVRIASSVVIVRGYSAPEGGEIERTFDAASGTILG